ncbi:TIGR00270 family protein [archaeon]|nr:TIGR00270 family protein [archaeon]
MGICDLCGKENKLFTAKVEGTELNVCSECGKFGKVYKPVPPIKPPKPKQERVLPEVLDVLTADYSKLIRQAREKLGLTQEEFAKRLNERESFIQKVENGSLEPSIDTARKLEKLLNIKLVEEVVEEHLVGGKKGPQTVTIGDLVKIRTRP